MYVGCVGVYVYVCVYMYVGRVCSRSEDSLKESVPFSYYVSPDRTKNKGYHAWRQSLYLINHLTSPHFSLFLCLTVFSVHIFGLWKEILVPNLLNVPQGTWDLFIQTEFSSHGLPGFVEESPNPSPIYLRLLLTVGTRNFWPHSSSELEGCHEITWCLEEKGKISPSGLFQTNKIFLLACCLLLSEAGSHSVVWAGLVFCNPPSTCQVWSYIYSVPPGADRTLWRHRQSMSRGVLPGPLGRDGISEVVGKTQHI